jgi:hypothetical protein
MRSYLNYNLEDLLERRLLRRVELVLHKFVLGLCHTRIRIGEARVQSLGIPC